MAAPALIQDPCYRTRRWSDPEARARERTGAWERVGDSRTRHLTHRSLLLWSFSELTPGGISTAHEMTPTPPNRHCTRVRDVCVHSTPL